MTPGSPQGATPSPACLLEPVRTGDNLRRLADVLGVPVSAFSTATNGQDEAVLQVADLVTDFAAIDNPAARRTCLAFVRAMANS